ncbi:hypothetical protein BJV82DRAFT_668079 [Fennellomyces sp. T-0311]|nr:hypothetical protein BJV82DRAFT_668079 [Fennellomyces sp. T-0311]
MEDNTPVLIRTLTFYIEHISNTSGNISNTIIKLVIIGEVTYDELKAHVRQRMDITEDFELDYTPQRNDQELVAFKRIMSPNPSVRMYTVPLQEPGAAPWYLYDTRWCSLSPRIPIVDDEAARERSTNPEDYTDNDLLWQSFPGLNNQIARQYLQSFIDQAPRHTITFGYMVSLPTAEQLAENN